MIKRWTLDDNEMNIRWLSDEHKDTIRKALDENGWSSDYNPMAIMRWYDEH